MVGLITGIMPNFSLQTGRLVAMGELKRYADNGMEKEVPT